MVHESVIFFDLDGTLIDVEPRHYRVYGELVHKYAGKPLPQKEYWVLKRKKTRWPELLPLSGIPPEKLGVFLQDFIQRIEDPAYLETDQLFPGAGQLLKDMSVNHTCYLVSLRRQPERLKSQLDALGVSGYFAEILSGHSETDGYDVKIELIKNVLGDKTGTMVGDTEADIMTAKNLGLMSVAVLSGIRDREFLEALHPDYVFDSVTELKELE
jgi:phosphoglycolate phosphatase-like HAD superfamily hydrolase